MDGRVRWGRMKGGGGGGGGRRPRRVRLRLRLFQRVNAIHGARLSRHLTLVFKCGRVAGSALPFVAHHRRGAKVG